MNRILASLAEVFGTLDHETQKIVPLEGIGNGITIEVQVWDGTETGDEALLRNMVPPIDWNFRMPKDIVRDLNAWMQHGKDEPLLAFGPTGCGKTSTILQLFARTGKPVYRVNMSSGMELHDLFGFQGIRNGDTKFQPGPLVLAAQHGVPVLLDEFGRAKPEVTVGLNGVLDVCSGQASSFTVPNSDEIVIPKKGFTVIATDNTNLGGDESGNYQTAQIQDVSLVERFGMSIKFDYPKDEERQLLLNELLVQKDEFFEYLFDQEGLQVTTASGVKKGSLVTRQDFVDGVIQFRDMVRTQSRDGGNNTAAALERTLSVRTLRRWMRYVMAFAGAPNRGVSALHYSLERVLTNTCTPSTKIAIHTMVTTVFGVKEKLK